MMKLVKEVLRSKMIALVIVAAVVALSAFAFYYNGRADANVKIERYYYGKTSTVEDIQNTIEETMADYNDSVSSAGTENSIARNKLETVFVLRELLANNGEIKITDVYDGSLATRQDSCSYIAESVPVAALLTVITAAFLTATLITREFDEGVHIYIYNVSRTKKMLKRLAIVLASTALVYGLFAGYVLIISRAFPDVFSYGLIVAQNRAFILPVSEYLGVYVFGRYLYVSLFGTLLIILSAIIAKKSIFVYGTAAAISGIYFLLKAFLSAPLAALGLCGEELMYFFTRAYFNLTPMYVIFPAALIVLYLRLVFERADL